MARKLDSLNKQSRIPVCYEAGLVHGLIHFLGTGLQSAKTSKVIAQYLGTSERQVRLEIRELIREGMPIASSTDKNGGYYIANTQREVKAYAQSLRTRLIEDAIRRRDFLRASKAILYPGQLPLV